MAVVCSAAAVVALHEHFGDVTPSKRAGNASKF